MPLKLRYQNPSPGDTVRLNLDIYNSNNYSDPTDIEKVDIYFLDPSAKTDTNPDGRTLFTTVLGSNVTKDSVGIYHLDIPTTIPSYVVGNYLDVWTIQFTSNEPAGTVENCFTLFPELWFTSPIPIVYDFQFRFSPSRWRKGEKKSLQVEITPLVPKQSDLLRYYANLAIAADIFISIEINCGDCVPCEEDLRLIVDAQPIDYKEKCVGFYKWDTTDLDCGIYNVWAKMIFGDNIYVSEKQTIQIFS